MTKATAGVGGLVGERAGADGTATVPDVTDTATTPRPYEVRALPRKRCRIRSCTETIPHALGYAPDWTCWRHHRLVVPELVGAGDRRG